MVARTVVCLKQSELFISVKEVQKICVYIGNWKPPLPNGVEDYSIKRFVECHKKNNCTTQELAKC